MRLILVLFLFAVVPFSSFAQDEKPDVERLMADPSSKQMNEAQNFLQKCRLNAEMNTRHNCKCLALQYLEKRVEKGDDVRSSEILSKLRNVCLNDNEKEMKDLGYKDMSDVPQEILDEAVAVNNECKENFAMRTHHDCDCIAGKFIDDRLELGPLIDVSAILARYQATCKNSPELAGYQFTSCMEQYEMMVPEGLKPKYYCECYASEYAKANEKYTKKPDADTESYFMTTARGICMNKLGKDEKYKR